MATALWIVLVVGSTIAGVAIVGVLVVTRIHESLAAVAGLAGFAASIWAFGQLGTAYARTDVLLYALGISLAALGGGYALCSALLDRLAGTPRLPTVTIGEDVHRTRAILLVCAESASYDPRETSRELTRLAEEGLIDLTIGVTPFMYAAQKSRYRAIGGESPTRAQAHQLAEAVEALLDRERFDGVEVAWCEHTNGLAECVARAAAAGCRRVVVAPVAVGESAEMADAKRAVDQMRLREWDVGVAYAQPVWNSDAVLAVLVERITAAVDHAASTGVALIAHGQPESREQAHASFDANESAFVNRARLLLAEQGIEESRVLVAWAEWRDPDVSATVRHLAARGCTRVLVVPACFPFDDLVTRLDIPLGIRQARIDPKITVITLNAWTDDRRIVETVREAILETEAELLDAP